MFQPATPIVKNIIIINVLMFVAAQAFEQFWIATAGWFPLSSFFWPWQVITHMFQHGGVSHILFNMLGVYFLGSMLERHWGGKRFLQYYLITGLGAFALHYGVAYWEMSSLISSLPDDLRELVYTRNIAQLETTKMSAESLAIINQLYTGHINVPVVGASGAVFGLIMAYAYLFPNTRLMLIFPPIPVKAKWLAIGLAAFELYNIRNAAPNDNVAHYAHLGGMLVGFLVLRIWQRNRSNFY